MTHVLDTNILSDLIKANYRLVARFEAVPETDRFVTTTVTRYEILRGRYAAILAAADKGQLLLAQRRLSDDESWLAHIAVLPVTPAAADHFERLCTAKKHKKIGRGDILIASIAPAERATLVTRNTKDFVHIPGLMLENWAD